MLLETAAPAPFPSWTAGCLVSFSTAMEPVLVDPALFFDFFVDCFATGSASDRLLLPGALAIDGRVGSACAVFSGAAGNLRSRSAAAPARQLGYLFVDHKHHFLWRLFGPAALAAVFRGMIPRILKSQVLGNAARAYAFLLERMRGVDGGVAAGCAALSGATGDLRCIGSIRELVVDDNNKSSDASKRRGQGEALVALLDGDGELILLSHLPSSPFWQGLCLYFIVEHSC